MSKGAKIGQNRFAGAQKRHHDYRVTRIKEEVIPKLIAFVGKMAFDGTTPFSRFCAELFNDGLAVNEKSIGYRTLVQVADYWSLLEPIYLKHWDSSRTMAATKDRLVRKLAVQRAEQLQAENERLKNENKALRASLRNQGASATSLPAIHQVNTDAMNKFDKTCRALKLVLDASDGMFSLDMDAQKISCTYNDLEPTEGLVPSSLLDPFARWIKAKVRNHDDQ